MRPRRVEALQHIAAQHCSARRGIATPPPRAPANRPQRHRAARIAIRSVRTAPMEDSQGNCRRQPCCDETWRRRIEQSDQRREVRQQRRRAPSIAQARTAPMSERARSHPLFGARSGWLARWRNSTAEKPLAMRGRPQSPNARALDRRPAMKPGPVTAKCDCAQP